MEPSRNLEWVTVKLDNQNPSRTYFAGEIMSGRVVIHNLEKLLVKKISIFLDGSGRTSWKETDTRIVTYGSGQPRTETYTKKYSSSEQYVNHWISLVGDDHIVMTLDPGVHVYLFHFILPTNLPTSFQSEFGTISYDLQVKVERPLRKPNIRSRLPIKVNGILDLNLEPAAANPQREKGHTGSNCCFCRKGQISLVLKLSKSGYVPGEVLDFSAEVSNDSNKRVTGLRGTLQQVYTFHYKGKTKKKRICVREAYGQGVEDHEMWVPQPEIRIPKVPPTRFGGLCKIIDVRYFFLFKVKISGLSQNLTKVLPVMIGTIPLRSPSEQLHASNRVKPLLEPAIQVGNGTGLQLGPEPAPVPSRKGRAPQPPSETSICFF